MKQRQNKATKVAIGSKNPAKIQAVKLAFEAVWPDQVWVFEGVKVQAGVSNQPMSDQESIKGAKARAKKALKALSADFGVGLEGGLHQIGQHWFDGGWCVVVNSKGELGIGSSAKIPTPKKIMKQVMQGKELGEVIDIIFRTQNAKQGDGHFGLMTKNKITRTSGYRDGIIMALSRFIHPDLF